ncbi:MAG TPA: tyrosine-type recombinase/integrase [Solirubrobacteraceae bacterium]|jgi:integrase
MPGHVRSRGKRRDGTTKWQARWRDPRNPAIRKEKQFRDKDVARRWITRMDAEAEGARFEKPTEAPRERLFREVVAIWKDTCWTGLAPSTTARYKQVLRTYLEPEFKNAPIKEMTRERLRLYFAALSKAGKAPGTVRKVHTVLSAIMSEAVELDLLPANPCTRMRGLPANQHEEPVFLTAEQVRDLAEAMPTPQYRVLIYTAAYTGLRAGELAALRRRDVDAVRGVVHVRQALKALDGPDGSGGDPVFGSTKTGKTRTVTLPRFLRTMLAEHLISSGATPDTLIFTAPEGGVLRHGLFYRRVFKPTLRGDKRTKRPPALPAELHALRFHDLRHTCASLLIAQGAHPKIIQERLGHASITTTMNRYGHLFDGLDAPLIEALDAAHDATQPSEVKQLPQAVDGSA